MNDRAQEAVRILRESGQLDDAVRRELLELLLAPARPPRMTYEEFLAWADEDTLAEWVDGEVILTSPSSKLHQHIAGFLYILFRFYSELRDLGEVVQPPFQMKLAHSGREPDVMFIARERLDRLKETYLDGPADLVVEVVSPESAGRDRGDKLYEYEEAGIREYWLIEPLRQQAEFFVLSQSGHYERAAGGASGIYHSAALPGFWLKIEWLWQDPLPAPLHVLAEIAGIDPSAAAAFDRR